MKKLMGCAFLFGLAVTVAGCTEDVGGDNFHIDCPPRSMLTVDDDQYTELCAMLVPGGGGDPEPDWRVGTVEPPPPPIGPVSRMCAPTPTPTPTPTPPPIPFPPPITPIPPPPTTEPVPIPPVPPAPLPEAKTADLAPAPACPAPQYKTVFKKFRGPLLVGGRNFGEHSATRMVLWEATWDVVQNRYTWKPIDVYETGNHGPSPSDPDMKKYAEISSPWTFADGVGKAAFVDLQNKWCPCDGHINHQTSKDSCYGFRAPNHVCHSDTIYQEILFRGKTGVGAPPANQCGTGLFGPGRFAP